MPAKIVLFRNPKKAKLMAAVTGVIAGVLLCNPSQPQQCQVTETMGTLPSILLAITGIWAAQFAVFALHALRMHRRAKRLQELGPGTILEKREAW